MSGRCNPTSRCSRERLNQRLNVGIQRRDIPEMGQTDFATLRRCDVENQRRDVIENTSKCNLFNKGLR